MTTRVHLPQRRANETFNLRHWNQEWTVTVGFYPDNKPGEVFVSGAKSGVDLEASARDQAVLLSLCLQYRVPLEVIKHALTRNQDESPSTMIGAVVDKMSEP